LRFLARGYFAAQSVAGAIWWAAVFTVPTVRTATLGRLPHELVAVLDVPLFVGASLLVALGVRRAVWVAVPWTLLVTGALGVYATVTGEAVAGLLLMIAASAGSLGAGAVIWWGRVPAELLFVGPFAFRPARETSIRRDVVSTIAQLHVYWGLYREVILFIHYH